ncbi:MAG: hypothetical protein ACRDHE_03290, partial [Ktedonobacterales bacterium]
MESGLDTKKGACRQLRRHTPMRADEATVTRRLFAVSQVRDTRHPLRESPALLFLPPITLDTILQGNQADRLVYGEPAV